MKEGKNAILYFEDDGIPFNPLEKANPDMEEFLEERRAWYISDKGADGQGILMSE